MKTIFSILCLSIASVASSLECPPTPTPKPVVKPKVVKPKPVVKPKVVVVNQPKVVVTEKPCCATSNESNDSVSSSKNDVRQGVTVINNPPSRVANIKYVDRPVFKYKRVIRPNRVLLTLGASHTDFQLKRVDCCNIDVKQSYELDIGVLFLRDFGGLTLGIGGTLNKNIYGAFGFNF